MLDVTRKISEICEISVKRIKKIARNYDTIKDYDVGGKQG